MNLCVLSPSAEKTHEIKMYIYTQLFSGGFMPLHHLFTCAPTVYVCGGCSWKAPQGRIACWDVA